MPQPPAPAGAHAGGGVARSQVAAAVVRSGSFLVDNRAFLEVLRGVKARVADTQTNLKPVALATVAALVR